MSIYSQTQPCVDVTDDKSLTKPSSRYVFTDNRQSTKLHSLLKQTLTSQQALPIQLASLKIGANTISQVKDLNTFWAAAVKPTLDNRGIGSWGKKRSLRAFFDTDRQFNNEEEFLWSLENTAVNVPKDASRTRPKWDKFWQELHPNKGEHRRHIVESSVMKSAVYKVIDSATTPLAKQQALSAFNSLLGTSETELSKAEYKMAFRLHNNRTNIFLGKGKVNSAIGALSHQFKESDINTIMTAFTDDGIAAGYQKCNAYLTALKDLNTFGAGTEIRAALDILSEHPLLNSANWYKEILELIDYYKESYQGWQMLEDHYKMLLGVDDGQVKAANEDEDSDLNLARNELDELCDDIMTQLIDAGIRFSFDELYSAEAITDRVTDAIVIGVKELFLDAQTNFGYDLTQSTDADRELISIQRNLHETMTGFLQVMESGDLNKFIETAKVFLTADVWARSHYGSAGDLKAAIQGVAEQ